MMELIYVIIAVVLLYVLLKLLKLPFQLLYNGVIGAVILWVLNIFGPIIGISLPITVFNALIAGFFGIPGVLFLLAWHYL